MEWKTVLWKWSTLQGLVKQEMFFGTKPRLLKYYWTQIKKQKSYFSMLGGCMYCMAWRLLALLWYFLVFVFTKSNSLFCLFVWCSLQTVESQILDGKSLYFVIMAIWNYITPGEFTVRHQTNSTNLKASETAFGHFWILAIELFLFCFWQHSFFFKWAHYRTFHLFLYNAINNCWCLTITGQGKIIQVSFLRVTWHCSTIRLVSNPFHSA